MHNTSSTLSLLFRRSAAFLYDCLLLIALFFIVTAAAIALNDGQAIEHMLFKIMLVGFSFLFFDWFWRHGGQTLGMRAWRIKIESLDAPNLTFSQSGKRFLTGTLLFGITLLYMFVSDEQEALHDKLSKTKIIRDIS